MKCRKQQFTFGLAALLLAAAILPSLSAPARVHTGIQGRTHVFTGPFFPGPVAPAVVTTFPVSTSFTVLVARTDRVVAEVTTDANGDFLLALPPGRYTIVPGDLEENQFCSLETPEAFEVVVKPRRISGAGFTYIADCPPIFAE